jgi:glycosyltransferase involved in cell wall biosynthesis
MKIAFVTTEDSSDRHAWSGCVNNMLRALQNSGFQTEIIDRLKINFHPKIYIKRAIYKIVLSKKYLTNREPIILKNYAAQVENYLASINCDVVFSPGTIPIAYLQTKKPIVFWTDSAFAGMINFYPEFSNLCTESIRDGNKVEQLALSKSCLAIYTSEWAANTALQNYDVDPGKVKVVPFGANINCYRDFQDIKSIINNKKFDICKLLFVGVDWVRKGGDIALRVADLLNQRGISTELHIVGCNPGVSLPRFAKQHGFISKNTEEGRRYLDNLMYKSHFLIVPSRAEAYGVVFVEANSFGVPSLGTKVGGITTIIQDRKNGQTFALDESPEKYCDYIEKLMSSREEYEQLAMSSFREYSERLNWLFAGKKVYDLIKKFCG